MIVYNVNPAGSKPIVIVADWVADELGGPAIRSSTIMIAPGQGIDLSLIGLEPPRQNEKENDL